MFCVFLVHNKRSVTKAYFIYFHLFRGSYYDQNLPRIEIQNYIKIEENLFNNMILTQNVFQIPNQLPISETK